MRTRTVDATLRTLTKITYPIQSLLHRRQPRSSSVEYRRILPSRALLVARISTLGLGQVILVRALGTGKNMIANHHRDTPIIHLAGGLMLLAASAIACANAPEGAQAVVEETVDKIMVSLRTDREAILKDPVRVRALVDETLVPRVDFDRVARLTLGKKHWKGASSEQRGQFTHEFREYLVRFYSTALAEYAKDNDVPEDVIKLLPLGPQESDRFTLIRSHVGQPSGDPISVDYRMYFAEGEWKVIDVSVGGVSMVKNYRSNFESEIRQSGLDGLIRKLATRNREFASN